MGRGMLLGFLDPAWVAVAVVVLLMVLGVTRLQTIRESSFPIVTSATLSTCADQAPDPRGQLGECYSGHGLQLASRERRAILLDDPCFNWGDLRSSNGLAVTVSEEAATTGAGCGGTWRRVHAVITGIFRGRALLTADGRNLKNSRTERFVIVATVR